MSAGSLVGFGLVALLVSAATSAALGGLALAGRRRLAAWGPTAERAGAALALVLPPITGVTIALAMAFERLCAAESGGDHCLARAHQLHLCLQHGGAWAAERWAVALLAAATTAVAARAAVAFVRRARAGRALRCVARVSQPLGVTARDVLVAPAALPFAFTAGLFRPRVYVSQGLWDRLDGPQREALLAHERAHLCRGDVARRLGLELAGLLAAPVIADRLLAAWTAATERWCDAAAAARVADPLVVADALVCVARLGTAGTAGAHPASALGFSGSRDDLGARVAALLAWDGREVQPRRLTEVTAAALAAAIAGALYVAQPLHHFLEHLLGMF